MDGCAKARRWRRGLGLFEVVVVSFVLALLVAMVLPMLGRTRGCGSRQIKDSANVRSIHQGLVLFAQNNNDRYPLPSLFDRHDATVKLRSGEDPTVKDTTAAVISMLIYGNFFGPEVCVSPAEANANIRYDADYEFASPKHAADPKLAMWDPAFSADFTAPGGSNFSYAHMMPTGARLDRWSPTFEATQAVVGSRGPRISAITKQRSPSVSPAFDPASNTLLIHGSPKTWEGNIAYNDNHISFETEMSGGVTYADAAGATWADLLFADETDDASGLNNVLGVYVGAGPTAESFALIWD